MTDYGYLAALAVAVILIATVATVGERDPDVSFPDRMIALGRVVAKARRLS